jgi:hypothetical protein
MTGGPARLSRSDPESVAPTRILLTGLHKLIAIMFVGRDLDGYTDRTVGTLDAPKAVDHVSVKPSIFS